MAIHVPGNDYEARNDRQARLLNSQFKMDEEKTLKSVGHLACVCAYSASAL